MSPWRSNDHRNSVETSVPPGENVEGIRPTYGVQTRSRVLFLTVPLHLGFHWSLLVLLELLRLVILMLSRLREISNAEFRQSIHMFAQLVASQSRRSDYVGLVANSSEVTRIWLVYEVESPNLYKL